MSAPKNDRARVAVAGCGVWGQNHVRVFSGLAGVGLPGVELRAVCDPDEAHRRRALAVAAHAAPEARAVADFDALLAAPDVDAIVLATPSRLHAAQTLAALAAGKHVLVEKPLALSLEDAEAVQRAAEASDRTVLVGHLMIHHPAVPALARMLAAGEIGEVYYLYARRVNLGRLRPDENALWSLGPHDVSVILHLLGARPVEVSARGHDYLQPGVADVVFLHLAFADGRAAHVQLSWLDPHKERRLTIVGSRRMVEFDDTHPSEKLRVYDKGYDRPPEFADFAEYLTLRQGDVRVPRLDLAEPLLLECRDFVRAIQAGAPPKTSVADGVEVVRVLAAAQRSLDAGGTPVKLD